MDLERIKQNLRLRSGRSKKTHKQPVVRSNATPHVDEVNQKNKPNGEARKSSGPARQPAAGVDQQSIPGTSKNSETPQSTSSGAANVAKHRPPLTHASTSSNLKPLVDAQPQRFGKSGMERPRQGPVNELAITRTMSENDTGTGLLDEDSSSTLDFDLRAPPPRPKPPSIETLSESLFSTGHLNTLLRDAHHLARFTSFLTKYRPQYHPVLLRYLETQKAIKAVEYANAVAEGVPLSSDNDKEGSSIPRASVAATLDKVFEEASTAAFRLMLDSALPMYITYNLVKVVSECLVNEITGRQTPLMRDLVGGLSEVFCLSDPKQEDNPIIYASEEFYRYTGYGPDDVIGRNCRFLQGSKTKRESVARLRETIGKGEDLCETLLNYRRDGRPFINLLMIAPLHDDKGNVKYHIGAQVDVTGLVARGKGLDGFEQYMFSSEMKRREREARGKNLETDEDVRKPRALAKLRELSEMFDLEESAVVRSHSRSASASGDEDERSIGSSRKGGRRVLADSDLSSDNDDEDVADNADKTWKLGQSGRSGLSGRLPGVYESYLLVRPAPSLRIVFVSPKLRGRLGNVIQHPILSHLAASANTLSGLKESFGNGVPVSAKVNFLLEAGSRRDGTATRVGTRLEDAGHGRVCWISATPLLGSDDKIGVWIIVVVEKTKVPTKSQKEILTRSEVNQLPQQSGSNHARMDPKGAKPSLPQQGSRPSSSPPKQNRENHDPPIKPKRLQDTPGPTHNSRPPSAHPEQAQREERTEDSEIHNPSQVSAEYETLVLQEGGEEAIGATPDSANNSQTGAQNDSDVDIPTTGTRPPALDRSSGPDIDEGNDDDKAESSDTAVVINREQSTPDETSPKGRIKLQSPDDDDLDQSPNTPDSPTKHEDMVTNHMLEESSEGTASPPRPGAGSKDTGARRSQSYMDYLRHPGSRPSGEYNRAVSGSFLSARYDSKGEDQGDGDDFNGLECIRSPYSVD
ncbi:non-specific serine/threonine protein kinase [Cladophialophora carrionii]|uniref:Non-specific serine/threonine protein kinase n=1 Tax=Cladophialophora carrionii TaxID=86049 RepID=A0A1C1CU39_9EURO|nr:non-specific serine/threonine protein kinase [Cladophialophora carrionii]